MRTTDPIVSVLKTLADFVDFMRRQGADFVRSELGPLGDGTNMPFIFSEISQGSKRSSVRTKPLRQSTQSCPRRRIVDTMEIGLVGFFDKGWSCGQAWSKAAVVQSAAQDDRMICDARQHVGEVGFGIDAVEFCGSDQTVHRRGALTPGIGTRE
jgi:hypothetical protein